MTFQTISRPLLRLAPFWIFLMIFKFAAGLHYTLMAPLGEQLFPVWIVGIMVGTAAFAQMLMDVPSGYLLDTYGYKKLLIVTTILFAGAGIALTFGLTRLSFVSSLIISILGWQFFGPGIQAYIVNHANKSSVGRLVSSKDVFTSIGIVLSSALTVFAVLWAPRTIGWVLVGLFVIALAAIITAPADQPHEQSEPKPHSKHPHRRKLHPTMWRNAIAATRALKPASILLMVTSFTAAAFYGIIWFVVPLLIAHTASSGILGIGLGVFDFSVVILGFFLGRIVDSFNKKMLVLLGILTFAVAGTLLASNFGFMFLLLGFVAATGDELSSLSLWAWLYAIDTDHDHYGLLSGTIGLFDDLGWAVGPIIAGILYSLVGPAWTIAAGGLLVGCNIIIFFFTVKHPLPNQLTSIIGKRPHRARYKH